MTTKDIQLDKNFDRKIIEKKWYQQWLDNNVFTAGKKEDQAKEPYVIMMPPPNVTGVLHNGHALFVTLQDILVRFWRMKGRDVLWLPGTDHAGIATQTVVERELLKKENKTRHDLGREEFLERVFAWKDKHGEQIIEQMKLLGASADWGRLRFTMDEQCSFAVKTAFVKLWDQGLIYRKERLVSWDPKTKTALSNEEVDHVEREGELFYFAYKLAGDDKKEIVVATTRPETMLGDTAVAVHPQDERYIDLIGQPLVHPFIAERKIVVIADDFVDKEFGSGAVKITPAHDPNDFSMGERHKLASINIFTLDGSINDNGGTYAGMPGAEARTKIKKDLENLGLFRKVERITHAVSVSQRSGADIEPMLSRQYFVKTAPLAKKAYEAVNDGEVNIIPESFKKIWDHFLLNIQDWCISRQLWWGHRIPVYYHVESLKKAVTKHGKDHASQGFEALKNGDDIKKVLRFSLDELPEEVIRSFSHALLEDPKDAHNYLQEEDVLDTWFSAGLWPFATLGWPNKTADLARYYPGHVLETGSDILFFWVARMMMFGTHFMGQPPFKDIYLHSMVRDSHGRKMSKSLGNAIDPIDVIEGISLEDLLAKTKTYPVPKDHLPKVLAGLQKDFPEGIPSSGADGLRLSLAMFSGQGRDVKFSLPRVLGYRAFLNKVWNATRFCLLNIDEDQVQNLATVAQKLSLPDRYILSALNQTVAQVDQAIGQYKFSEAADHIYQFFWSEYCDKYIECAKVSFKNDSEPQQNITKSVLIHLLDVSMRMLHPFCPFISEEIWQCLPGAKVLRTSAEKFCATAPFPRCEYEYVDEQVQKDLGLIFEVSAMIRNARQASGLPANQPIAVELFAKDEKVKASLAHGCDLIGHLAKASKIDLFVRGERQASELSATNSCPEVDAVIPLKGLIDVDKELKRLEGALTKLSGQKLGLQKRLESPSFVENAPPAVVEECRTELARLLEQEEQLILAQTRLKKT